MCPALRRGRVGVQEECSLGTQSVHATSLVQSKRVRSTAAPSSAENEVEDDSETREDRLLSENRRRPQYFTLPTPQRRLTLSTYRDYLHKLRSDITDMSYLVVHSC